MFDHCDSYKQDLVKRVREAEGTGRVPRTEHGQEIIVLQGEHQWTTSAYSVESWEVNKGRFG